ncbi:MAG: hypothetical protein BTN85_1735 [Candidatus Methanohalarchaeum thermophilum]|uniref:Uncharacterized protein n=1 Tax=Methanohalarchaeum thermophilum TaxID=1903181 RepID=A0A1Q6DXZ5_METT1|nr:MAG: hypothetical protein BTN85_1735 [Candidatus Methanohalarchaeum thermophilum]
MDPGSKVQGLYCFLEKPTEGKDNWFVLEKYFVIQTSF